MISLSLDESELPLGSTLCLLCNGIVAYKGEDRDRFYNHMKFQHGAFFNLEFIKAGCLMDDDEKTAVIGIMESKENAFEEDEAVEEESIEETNEKLLTEEDYMEVVEENETKKGNTLKNVEESVRLPPDEASTDKAVKETDSSVVTNDLNLKELIKNDEKFIEKVSEELKLVKDYKIDKEVTDETGSNSLPSNVKLRNLRIDIPILRPNNLMHLPAIDDQSLKEAELTVQNENNTSEVKNFILDNAVPKVKETRRKVFTCDICKKEFPVNFHNLVRHKMKAHRVSKKIAKVISMQHVRYETVYTEVSTSSTGDKVEAMETQKESYLKPPVETGKESKVHNVEKNVKEAENEPVISCVLCNMAWIAKSLKSHLRNKHEVVASKIPLFLNGEEGLAQLEKENSVNKNKCKICDVDHDNLGKLWNHYKRSHRVKKEFIKSLISKSKCTICAANVTFIGDHYRTVHRFEKENTSNGKVMKEVVDKDSDSLTKDKESKSDDGTSVEKHNVTGPSKEPSQLSEKELIARLPSGSLTQFPKFFDEMKKYYPGRSEKEIKLKTIQMFKKVKHDNQGRESPVSGDNVNKDNPKTYDLPKVKEQSASVADPVPSLKTSSLLESEQIKTEPLADQTNSGNLIGAKSYTCVICHMKVPHIWNHCRDSHKMSKEEFKVAMQSFHQKNKTSAVNQNREMMNTNRASPGIKINTTVAQQILPVLGLMGNGLSEELFIIDGKVGTGHLCNYCDFTCDKKANLNIHTQLKHAENIRKETGASEAVKMECEPCNLVFRNDEMELHKKIVHSIFTCEECETTFTNRKEFRNHTIMHMMESEVQTLDVVMNTPESIGGQNSDKKSLKVPVPKNLKEEPAEEYFYCDDCEFSSNLEDDYRKHVQSSHVAEQPSKELSSENLSAFPQPLYPVSDLEQRKNVAQPRLVVLKKRVWDEKTECKVCNRHVSHVEAHMKRNHPELEKIKDTPLYQEILADRSLAHNPTGLREINLHKPIKNEFISTLKEKISKDIEPAESSELQVEGTSNLPLNERVITINNTAMPLEECSLCHQKVLYLSQHIEDIHGTPQANISVSDDPVIAKDKGIAQHIKKENVVEEDNSGKGEYVANLINKLKDFDSEDEDDPAPSLDEQDVADTMDLISDPNNITGQTFIGAREKEATTGLVLIDIDPKKLYDNSACNAVPLSPATYESKSEVKLEEFGPALPFKKNFLTLDHLPESLAENIRNSKYFQEHPTVLKNCTEKNTKTYHEDPNLLPSWKVKFYPRPADGLKAARNDRVFLTPETMQIRSTYGVVEYMRCSGQYIDSQIKHVMTYLRTPNMKRYK